MALIKEYKIQGATVQIFDDAYQDIRSEELQQRKTHAQRVAGEIMCKNILQKIKK